MAQPKTLYDTDFLAWTEDQAIALRSAAEAGSNRALDWENLAEEIESLGKSQRSALASQLRRIVRHLLKLQHSRARQPRGGWIESIGDARSEIEDLLETSPTLKTGLDREIRGQIERAIKLAVIDLEDRDELDPATTAALRATSYTQDQILGDWLPGKQLSGKRQA
jgi:Domain of unknown function DUF29